MSVPMAEVAIDARLSKKPAWHPKALPIAAVIGAAALAGIGIGSRLSHEGQAPASSSSSGPDSGHPGVVLPTTTMPSEQALAEIATVMPDASTAVPARENTLAYVREPYSLYTSPDLPYTMARLDTWTVSTDIINNRPINIFTGEVHNGIPADQISIYIGERKVDPQTGQELTPEQYMDALIEEFSSEGIFTYEALRSTGEKLNTTIGINPGTSGFTLDSYDGLSRQLLKPPQGFDPAISVSISYLRAINPTTGKTDNWVIVESTADGPDWGGRVQTKGNITEAIDLYPTSPAPAAA